MVYDFLLIAVCFLVDQSFKIIITRFDYFFISHVLNVGYVSNETNTDVRMYTLRIYSYVVKSVVRGSTCCTSGYTLENENDDRNLHWFIYKCLNRQENI